MRHRVGERLQLAVCDLQLRGALRERDIGLLALRYVVEENGDLALFRIPKAKGVNVVPAGAAALPGF